MSDQHEIPMGYFYSQPMVAPSKKKKIKEEEDKNSVQRILEGSRGVKIVKDKADRAELRKDDEEYQHVGVDGLYVFGVHPYLPWVAFLECKTDESPEQVAVEILKLVPKDLSYVKGEEAVNLVNSLIAATNTTLVFVDSGAISKIIARGFPLDLESRQEKKMADEMVAVSKVLFSHGLGKTQKEVQTERVL